MDNDEQDLTTENSLAKNGKTAGSPRALRPKTGLYYTASYLLFLVFISYAFILSDADIAMVTSLTFIVIFSLVMEQSKRIDALARKIASENEQ